MQTPPSNPQKDYSKQGFTQVSPGYQPNPPVPPAAYPPPGGAQQANPTAPPVYPPASGGPPQQQPPNPYYQQAYQPVAPAPFPQQRKPFQAPKKSAGSRVFHTLIVLAAMIAIVFVVIAISQLMDDKGQQTATVMSGTMGANHTGVALVVRNETVYTQDGVSQIDYAAEEASVVTRGDTVCTVYSSGFSNKELKTLQGYRDQIKEYLQTLTSSAATADTVLVRYESAVLESALETQALVHGAEGSLLAQEEDLAEAIGERAYYLKQKYTDDDKLLRLYDIETNQKQRIETWTKQYAATDGGIVSFYTDGFELALTTGTYSDFSPAQVRSMYNGNLPKNTSFSDDAVAVYRLVRQGTWVVLMLCDDTDWTPAENSTYELLIESYDSTKVTATIESVTRSGGELLLRLVIKDYVDPVFYIRSCSVQLSESIYNLTVPVSAIYTQSGQIGVVIVQPEGKYFIPVTVISQNSVEAHIIPEYENILVEGSTVLLH